MPSKVKLAGDVIPLFTLPRLNPVTSESLKAFPVSQYELHRLTVFSHAF